MPLEIVIHKVVLLDDTWLTKEQWEDAYKNKEDFLDLAEFLNEDIYDFIERQGGGLFSMIKSARWVD